MKKETPSQGGRICYSCNVLVLLTGEVGNNDQAVHVRTYHLLGIASHDTLAGHEIFCTKDGRRDLQRNIWSVHKSAFKEAGSSTSNQNQVPDEVWINMDIHLAAQCTNY